ncbi:MAG: 3-mercaptopyruvate sulfurtransferase [Methylococcaceae bacterium]|nr:MAG: 3-mercaptopyruvate sulfurtransferase [Methylococcaceae bacterium]
MNYPNSSALLDCRWLADNLDHSDVVVLDAGFFLPTERRDAAAEYRQCHIAGAQFFDIDAVADHGTPLPHMLPSPDTFAAAAGKLGIGNDTLVVTYDNNRFMAAARAWWMFRVFGHDQVAVLDGGLQRWRALGLPADAAEVARAPRRFEAGFRPGLVRDLAQMRRWVQAPDRQLLDARSPGRFEGSAPEPRPGVRSGHIPGSRHLFYADLVDPDNHQLLPNDALAARFAAAGIDTAQPVTTTCGTGVTAAILALALYQLGRQDVAVYDGSWSEWGGLADTPVALGPA